MKTASIVWGIIIGAIEVIVVLEVLNVGFGQFETVVLCGLVIIYASIKTVGSSLGYLKLEELVPEIRFKARVLQLLNDKDFLNREELEFTLKEEESKISRQRGKIYTAFGVNFIIYVIALFTLFNNI